MPKLMTPLFFDAAYEAFITDRRFPTPSTRLGSAIVRSSSALFQECWLYWNALRVHCAEDYAKVSDGSGCELWKLWNRRQSTKFNGVSYIVQRSGGSLLVRMDRRKPRRWSSSENAKILSSNWCSRIAVYVFAFGENAQWSLQLNSSISCCTLQMGTPGSGFGAAGKATSAFPFNKENVRNEADYEKFTV